MHHHIQGEDLNSSEEDCQLARRRIKVRPRGHADTSADESGPSSLQSSLGSSRKHEEDAADGDGQLQQQHYYQRQGAHDSIEFIVICFTLQTRLISDNKSQRAKYLYWV